MSILAPVIAPHDPYEDVGWRNSAPGEDGLILGADGDGRDVLSRLIWGGRISLLMGVVPTLAAMLASLLIGVVAAYSGRWVDQIIMRILDMFFAFPIVLMATVVAGILKPGLATVCIAIFIALIPYITRLVRTTTLTVKNEAYVEAARSAGARGWEILSRYIVPNVIAPVIVYTTTLMGFMIVLGSALGIPRIWRAAPGRRLGHHGGRRPCGAPQCAPCLDISWAGHRERGARVRLYRRRSERCSRSEDAWAMSDVPPNIEPVLRVENLRTYFNLRTGILKAVDGVSFAVEPGKVLCIVGESGSGKSVTALSILRLVDAPGRIEVGRILYRNTDLLDLSEAQMTDRIRETGSR